MAAILTSFEVMISCGGHNCNTFDGQTEKQRLATDLFTYDFSTCIDKSFEELDVDFKSYSDLTSTEGNIRLIPGVKKMIEAVVQFVRKKIMIGRNPGDTLFVAGDAQKYIIYKTHKKFMSDSKIMLEAENPIDFTPRN